MLDFGKRRRRSHLREQPFPPEWLQILERNYPLYAKLPPEDQRELKGDIQVFLAEKHFEGCGGLEITDEIRVTIAAQACFLLLHRENDDYPRLESILVYPSAYVARSNERLPGGIVHEGPSVRLGEAWSSGAVVLSWDDVRRGAADIHDGHNVVLHEFAHQLDQEDGRAQGLPVLERPSLYVAWARVLGNAFTELRDEIAKGHQTVLDAYGATNPAEFFAVATECFFEKPQALQKRHPELYDQLQTFYHQDPATYNV
ncbi:MAG: zinc-dependent peptidase [Candidatus Eisenbacteria bacterium]|uniref:Zinc-dependent peptidase n=1 Tax=Eiseniibacteriota bacterium TaxID=2212470 RepID=A0A948S3W2_UNCEI|nr:zinc-dependent peptidase [Candidatus Eisenbacteria bacterium]MBU1947202.1 zinc-dependent peptidase [Candidatus Eisenbacteria bacterium]MBU2693349.1 zinc-dependent peptidase [Candidatus Eisenbacteria bacterium]